MQKLYSKATFQFEFLARVGFSCPKLRVLDLFGTDTWADCLVALFFKDAFHSLHRYLYFMENEDDECSEYHPHDTSRYCQFCFDQWHPHQIERPFTNNPVIPLLDSVYDHVMRKYPRRSYCILRNCVRVSDLIKSPGDTCFELTRVTCDPVVTAPPPQPRHTGGRVLTPRSEPGVVTRSRTRRNQVSSSTSVSRSWVSSVRSSYNITSLVSGESKKSSERWTRARRDSDNKPNIVMSRSGGCNTDLGKMIGDTCDSDDHKTGVVTRAMKRKLVETGHETRAVSVTSVTVPAKRSKVEKVSTGKRKPSTRLATKKSKKLKEVEDEDEEVIVNTPAVDDKSDAGPVGKIHFRDWERECLSGLASELDQNNVSNTGACQHHRYWREPDSICYREIVGYPHLNTCVNTLEILNIGGSNVLGEFIPFLLLHTPKLKSLGQWLNTMIYGLEILKDLPGFSNYKNEQLQEISYSSDRNYFCQPYIGFVPESQQFKNVRKEMVRFSNKCARRVGPKVG